MSKSRFRRSTPKLPISEVNVLPYIDVMLVLLVIFMITAPMLMQGVEVELPKVTSTPITADPSEDSLVVSLKADGHYYLELGEDSDEPLELTVLIRQVTALKNQNPALPVYLRGDKGALYGEVMVLMSALETAGVSQVQLITLPADDS